MYAKEIDIFIKKFEKFNLFINHKQKIDNVIYYELGNNYSLKTNKSLVEIRIIIKDNSNLHIDIINNINNLSFNQNIKLNKLNQIFNNFNLLNVLMKDMEKTIRKENCIDYDKLIQSKNQNLIKKWNKNIIKTNDNIFINGFYKDGKTKIITNQSNKFIFYVYDDTYTLFDNFVSLLSQYKEHNYNKIHSNFVKNKFEIIIK